MVSHLATTIGGMVTLFATHGNTKAGAAAANVEQLGTSALRRAVFKEAIDNALSIYDLVTGR
jgi:hypothetical protein